MNKEENKIAAFSVGKGLKIGNADLNGVYVGDKLVAGNYFDFSQLWSNLDFIPYDKTDSYNVVLIVNLSTDTITFTRKGQEPSYIAPKSIDWFTVGNKPDNVVVQSIINGNRTVNAMIFTVTVGEIEIVTKHNISAGETITSYGQADVSPFGRTAIIFDA